MKTKPSIKGNCLCEKVSYEITGELLGADNCHCSMCRHQHGSAFASYASFNHTDFRWIRGETFIKIYSIASGAGWCFCSLCGSTLAGTENGSITSITLGTIEGNSPIKPDSHIFVGSKAPWYEIDDELPQFVKRASIQKNQ